MSDWKSALAAIRATEEADNKVEQTEVNSKIPDLRLQNEMNLSPAERKVARRKARHCVGVVYSTNPDYEYTDNSQEETATIPKHQQKLRLSMERAGRGGKTVTLVKGFVGPDESLAVLCKLLKQKCGVGGSAKDGEIIIQGDHRLRLVEILKKEGYSQTK